MREILFRGKRIDNGEWAFGNLVIQETDNLEVNFISNNETVVDVFIQPIKKVWDAHWNSFGRQEWKAVAPLLKVDPNNIGQYTGLKDKNGRRIFEGDIVRLYSEYHEKLVGANCVVKYGEFNCTCCNGVYGWEFKDGDIRDFSDYEVIGNIHDNPELMKEGGDDGNDFGY